MTCSACQLQIFDGELNRDAVVHLTACEDCRAIDREVRLNAAALSAMRDDVMPVQTVQRGRRWLPWVAAAAAAAVILSFGLRHQSAVPAPTAPLEATSIKPAPAAPLPPIPDSPRPVRSRPRPQPVLAKPTLPEPSEPLMVKFLVDDPDIVIYWLIEPKGEQAI
ncbi:MAG: hypothetical protein ABI811_13800 [Acidobacteriota bacterium]